MSQEVYDGMEKRNSLLVLIRSQGNSFELLNTFYGLLGCGKIQTIGRGSS